MTIRRGENWGIARPLPPDAPVVATDAELAALVASTSADTAIGVRGGDLARTIGATGDKERLYGPEAHTFSCDVMEIVVDDAAAVLGVAHVVIGEPWRRSLAAVCNAAWVGERNVNPRSHPNDGRAELIDARQLSFADRFKARRLVRTGAHLPHPDIETKTSRNLSISFRRSVPYRIDGIARGRGRSFSVTVVPDRFTIVI